GADLERILHFAMFEGCLKRKSNYPRHVVRGTLFTFCENFLDLSSKKAFKKHRPTFIKRRAPMAPLVLHVSPR
ncbi:MAG: hypothetical protein WBN66_03940, partial [Smithella sp.]